MKELEAAKAASVGHLLIKTARLLNERAAARAREQMGTGLRPSHLAVFAHVDFDGTRLSTIAERMGISKQAVGQLVGVIEDAGMLERAPDPTDGRARLVRFTKAGRQSLLDGLAVLAAVDDELRATMGERVMDTLHSSLTSLMTVLSQDASG
jgi:DNA-binding MarR family transcriptional regulator